MQTAHYFSPSGFKFNTIEREGEVISSSFTSFKSALNQQPTKKTSFRTAGTGPQMQKTATWVVCEV